MEEREKEFLLAEYEQAWAMILNLDERRFKFVEYYSAIFAGVAAVASNFVVGASAVSVEIAVVVTFVLGTAVAIGLSFLHMMRAERRANVRYRMKVNLIRGLMLSRTKDPNIVDYLSHKELGIKTHEDEERPAGIGSTLKGVVGFMCLEMGALLLGIAAVWGAYLTSR